MTPTQVSHVPPPGGIANPAHPLDSIASDIRDQLAERALFTQRAAPRAGDRDAVLGQLLLAARRHIGKGQWLQWIAKFGMTPRTAQRHIRAAVSPRTRRRTISDALRWEIWERDDFRCHYCGTRRFLETDHKVPLDDGGTDDAWNIVTACKPCNTKKGTRAYLDFLRQIGKAA